MSRQVLTLPDVPAPPLLTQTEANALFVKLAGDTMTGNLTIATSGPPILGLRQASDANNRAQLGQSNLIFGPGNTAADVTLSRTGAGLISTNSEWDTNLTLRNGSSFVFRHGANNFGTNIYAQFGYGGDGNNPRMQFGCNAWFGQYAGSASRPTPTKQVAGLASGIIIVEAGGSGGGTDGQVPLVDFIYQDGGWTTTYWTPAKINSRGTLWLSGGATTDGQAFLVARGSDAAHSASVALRTGSVASYARLMQIVTGPRFDLSANTTYDGTNWQRDDTTKGSVVVQGVDGAFAIYNGAAGSNPLTLIQRVHIDISGNVGIGIVSPPLHPARRALFVGDAAMLMSGSGYNATELRVNSYQDSANTPHAIVLGAAGSIGLINDTFSYANAPTVAAGALQTFTSRLFINASGTMGIGVTPSAWAGGYHQTIQVGQTGSIGGNTSVGLHLRENTYIDSGVTNRAIVAGAAGTINMIAGILQFYNAPSAAAGATQAYAERFKVALNGTATLTADAGQPNLLWNGSSGQLSGFGGSIPQINGPAGSYFMFGGIGGNLLSLAPATHNVTHIGWGDRGWALVHSVGGLVQDSLASDKMNFAHLDPVACVQAVLNTDWLSFEYKPPEQMLPTRPDEISDEDWTEQQTRYEQAMAEAALARKQRGYALGSDEYKVADLFGMADRKSAGTQSDLAVVACALQDALKRIAQLEAAR